MRYIETIKIDNGTLCNFAYHQSRMHQTAAVTLPKIIIPEEFKIGVVKCRVVYNNADIIGTTFSHYTLPAIRSLTIIEAPNIDYSRKYEDRSQLDAIYAKKGKTDDILISQNGYLTDTSFCNIVLENNDGLFTPNTPLLPGTKRRKLIENGTITPRKITINDLKNYHTIRLINAMIDLSDNISINITNITI